MGTTNEGCEFTDISAISPRVTMMLELSNLSIS